MKDNTPTPPDTAAPRQPERPAEPPAPVTELPASATTARNTLATAPARIGVLIVNLGTPDSANAAGRRRYLKEFLTDPRVIENQGAVWQLVLSGIILPIRPRVNARDYRKIWNTELNESPLKTFTRSQADKLAVALAPLNPEI